MSEKRDEEEEGRQSVEADVEKRSERLEPVMTQQGALWTLYVSCVMKWLMFMFYSSSKDWTVSLKAPQLSADAQALCFCNKPQDNWDSNRQNIIILFGFD